MRTSAAFLLLFLAAPASAAGWSNAQGWTVGEANPLTCHLGRDYVVPGDTRLLVMLATDGVVHLSATNRSWTNREREHFPLRYAADGRTFTSASSWGISNPPRRGFVAVANAEFLDRLAAGSTLSLGKVGAAPLAELRLDGSASAVAELRRCVGRLKARLAAGPSAPPPMPAPARIVEEPKLRKPFQSLVAMMDYPASALRSGEQGIVRFRLEVGAHGRVTRCTITASSGSSVLDSTTCRLLLSRARFTPARDSNGMPATGTSNGAIRWSISDPPPPATAPSQQP